MSDYYIKKDLVQSTWPIYGRTATTVGGIDCYDINQVFAGQRGISQLSSCLKPNYSTDFSLLGIVDADDVKNSWSKSANIAQFFKSSSSGASTNTNAILAGTLPTFLNNFCSYYAISGAESAYDAHTIKIRRTTSGLEVSYLNTVGQLIKSKTYFPNDEGNAPVPTAVVCLIQAAGGGGGGNYLTAGASGGGGGCAFFGILDFSTYEQFSIIFDTNNNGKGGSGGRYGSSSNSGGEGDGVSLYGGNLYSNTKLIHLTGGQGGAAYDNPGSGGGGSIEYNRGIYPFTNQTSVLFAGQSGGKRSQNGGAYTSFTAVTHSKLSESAATRSGYVAKTFSTGTGGTGYTPGTAGQGGGGGGASLLGDGGDNGRKTGYDGGGGGGSYQYENVNGGDGGAAYVRFWY